MTKFVRPTAAAKKTVTKPASFNTVGKTGPLTGAKVRITMPSTKKTIPKDEVITPTTKVEMPEPAAPAAEDEVLTAWQQVEDALNNLWAKFERPSWLRELANITCGLIAYASTFYMCMGLIDLVVVAAISYVGVGFISFLVAFFSMFLAFMLAFKVGRVAYNAAAAFDYDNVKSRVRGWLSFGSKPAAA